VFTESSNGRNADAVATWDLIEGAQCTAHFRDHKLRTTVLPCDDVLALRGRMWELSLLYDMDIQNFK
jgi:hypothetical protein